MSEVHLHSMRRALAATKAIQRDDAKTAKFIKPSLRSIYLRILAFFAVPVFLMSCSTSKLAPSQVPIDLAGAFPVANVLPGWAISQKVEIYKHDNLFNLVDGQAESFFAYGFEQVAVQRYQDDAGILMNVEIWRLATPADAYGLFSMARSGAPVSIGNEGDADPGRRLAFWQDRCFVNLQALQPVPDETLQAFARAIAVRLPSGGERPAIIDQLPDSGLVEPSAIFFHEEMSIQMEVWLGGENLLGLSQETNGVVGRYQMDGMNVRLMLVEYPASGQASTGLKALQSGRVADLVVSAVNGNLLGAVFGKGSTAPSQALLQEALK
jgi:hypothetical protein